MNYNNVSDIRYGFMSKFISKDIEPDGNIEILNACFFADEDSIFGKPNIAYRVAEVEWYDRQSLNVNDLGDIYGKVPVIWKEHAANANGEINSNYGWMIYSKENGSQYSNVLRELKLNPNSRRASMIYQRPSMHVDYRKDGINDFCCTNAVTYYIKDKMVHACVSMRSNDVVFGYINDMYWQKRVLIRLSNDLDLDVGSIYWHAQSLHMYPRHFHHIEKYIEDNK